MSLDWPTFYLFLCVDFIMKPDILCCKNVGFFISLLRNTVGDIHRLSRENRLSLFNSQVEFVSVDSPPLVENFSKQVGQGKERHLM